MRLSCPWGICIRVLVLLLVVWRRGFLLSIVSRMASLGWMTMRSMLGTRPDDASSPNMRCGGCWNWIATSVYFCRSALPERR